MADRIPLLITMLLIVTGAVGFVSIRGLLMLENRRRARKISGWTKEEYEAENESDQRRGDMKLTFRYGY
jgi:hypothetical protein